MNANAATSTTSGPVKLGDALAARRTPEQSRAWRALRWRELLTSLWSPLTLLGLVFLPYLLLIENVPSSGPWAQSLMRGFALALLVYWVGLLSWRLASPRERTLRRLRHEAHELIAEDERILGRVPDKVAVQVSERLTEQALRVEAASLAGDVPVLEKEIKELESLTSTHLGSYRKESGWHAVSGFVIALAVALLIRTVLIEPYRIPSGSMLPTLEIGDQVFVNKFIYGVRIPFVNKVPFQIVRAPKRGDVIVFNNPVDESLDFIKRIVGVPGDRVELVNEVVYVNGVEQPRELVSDDFTVFNQDQASTQWFQQREVLSTENLDGVRHAVLQDRHHPKGRVTEGPFIVPEGHVFVMGDNRDNSADSRYGLGSREGGPAYVPYGHIKGKAMVVWLSLGYDGLLSSLFGGTGLRVDRLFLPVR